MTPLHALTLGFFVMVGVSTISMILGILVGAWMGACSEGDEA